ncbi:phosphatidylinositol kinase [Rhizobium sp. Root1203]|uniref:type II toxin-antitoxin system HipA family toxin n=1 Tax=Rhizobium sp. Root1203 TaxID=1736427 RepID=UPI00070F9E4B|nr:HipA domain-containing protein [Rhizobium sp. Root1203]KQV30379.1 phosphatidylinositol kinase [Rhizobium sp. Root1203]
MDLELEIHHDGKWHVGAVVEIKEPDLGAIGGTVLTYDLDYWMENVGKDLENNQTTRDLRAVSVADPVDLENHRRKTWPPFLLDLMPSGRARIRLAEALKIDPDAKTSELPLLLRGAGSPVGNVRIKQAAKLDAERVAGLAKVGVTEEEIFGRSDRFIEIVDYFSIIASGSSGLQGVWPKVAMTKAKDGLYYPDPLVEDADAVDHVIVKLLRSSSERDATILSSEAIYAAIAKEIGLNVDEPSRHENGVLVIPRFDRRIAGDGVLRLGQESIVSAANIAEFAYLGRHEQYIDVLKAVSSHPFADIVEYVKREVANQALGNSDNHGRNTALSKRVDHTVGLSPLFDFAPMRLAPESIARSTRWGVMLKTHSDHMPDWNIIAESIFPDDTTLAGKLIDELAEFATKLETAPGLAKQLGAHEDVLTIAMSRCDEIVRSLDRPAKYGL